jgi:hypothetical protein
MTHGNRITIEIDALYIKTDKNGKKYAWSNHAIERWKARVITRQVKSKRFRIEYLRSVNFIHDVSSSD